MSPALRIHLLGDFHVLLDHAPVEGVLSSRLQALLACLILQRGKPQLRQHLAYVLWPDSSEGQARTNLRHLLHTLRHVLPATEEYLRVEPLTLEWRTQPLSSDVAEFEEALQNKAGTKQNGKIAMNHPSHLFTLRLWLEDLGNSRSEWRGQVQLVASRETRKLYCGR